MKRDEVEEFLRRAAARRAQAEAQRRAQAQGPVRPPQGQTPPPARSQRPPARLVEQRLEPEEAIILEPVDEVIIAEVAPTPGRMSSSIERRAAHRAHQQSEVELADDEMEAHLHQVFDHKLGHLKQDAIAMGPAPPTAGPGDTRVSDAAASIARMLRSSTTLRDAIILNEILTPPRHLW